MSSQLKWALRKWITTYVPLKVLSGSQSFLVSFCFQSMYPPWYSTLPQAQSNGWENPRQKTRNYKSKYFSLFFLGTLSQPWNLANTMKSGYFFSNRRVEQFNDTILLACPNHFYLPFCWQSLPMFDLADDSEFFYGFGADYWHIYVFRGSEGVLIYESLSQILFQCSTSADILKLCEIICSASHTLPDLHEIMLLLVYVSLSKSDSVLVIWNEHLSRKLHS